MSGDGFLIYECVDADGKLVETFDDGCGNAAEEFARENRLMVWAQWYERDPDPELFCDYTGEGSTEP